MGLHSFCQFMEDGCKQNTAFIHLQHICSTLAWDQQQFKSINGRSNAWRDWAVNKAVLVIWTRRSAIMRTKRHQPCKTSGAFLIAKAGNQAGSWVSLIWQKCAQAALAEHSMAGSVLGRAGYRASEPECLDQMSCWKSHPPAHMQFRLSAAWK